MSAVSRGRSCRSRATVSQTQRELGPSRVPAQAPQDPPALRIGSSRGPSPSTKRTFWPSASRHHEDVGEQDRRVEAEAPDRLQRHLGGQRRRVAQIEEAAGLRPARRGTRADSAPPAASARSAVATAPRRRTTRKRRVARGSGGNDHRDLPIQKSKDLNLVVLTLRRWIAVILVCPHQLSTGCAVTGAARPQALAVLLALPYQEARKHHGIARRNSMRLAASISSAQPVDRRPDEALISPLSPWSRLRPRAVSPGGSSCALFC